VTTARCGTAAAPVRRAPPARPGQVWCWDVTFLPSQVRGRWFYLYLILDLFSRKIVGFEVHDTDQAEHAAHLVRRTALAEGIHARLIKPVLHGDRPEREGHDGAGHAPLARHRAVAFAAAGQRRQCLRRGAVPHRQVVGLE
jgi:transposase InsO family protein